MKYEDAMKELESQTIKVGIGFLLSGKKLSDYGKLYDGSLKDFMVGNVPMEEAKEKYLEAKDKFEAPTIKKMDAAKKLLGPKVELIFRQPDVDELMSVTGNQKELPKGVALPLEVKEIAELALDYVGEGVSTAEQLTKSLEIIEKCLMDNTFEAPKPSNEEIMKMIRGNQKLSTGVVELFYESWGN